MEIVTSWKEEGMRQGTARVLLLQFARRFGPVPAELAAHVSVLPIDALDRLTDQVFDLSSLAALERWLVAERGRSAPSRRRPHKRAARKQ